MLKESLNEFIYQIYVLLSIVSLRSFDRKKRGNFMLEFFYFKLFVLKQIVLIDNNVGEENC